ncbi:MAG: orotidine-5'-phosphate decarboxylase [Planctomycetes bacterium]|nr:orotidine-5'-phosphate decarboxylase [Planctomycetota bacterium]
MTFANRLERLVRERRTVLCVGIDPRIDALPEELRARCSDIDGAAEAIAKFSLEIIDATADLCVCVKPQIAFFEQIGWRGFRVFEEVCAYARGKNVPVIADAKRGDIGSTSEAYADYFLGESGIADALTINPYLGADSLEPFTKAALANGRGVFILVKTSNKGSADIQDRESGGKKIFEHTARMVESLQTDAGELSSVGAVVGATYPEEAIRVREIIPRAWILVPGYGAQGGSAQDAYKSARADGLGIVVNSSRGIINAYGKSPYKEKFGTDWKSAIRAAAEDAARDLELRVKN